MITFEQAVKLATVYLEPDRFPWAARQFDNGWAIVYNTVEYPEATKCGNPCIFVSKKDGLISKFNYLKDLEKYNAAPVVRFFFIEDGEVVVNPNIDEECADW